MVDKRIVYHHLRILWEVPGGERVVGLCQFRDEIIIATETRVYGLYHDYDSDSIKVRVIVPEIGGGDKE